MTDAATPTLAQFGSLDARRTTFRMEVADDGGSYRATRFLGAPPERVFRAFTDPADVPRWFTAGAPEGSVLVECTSDCVEGGTYHYVMEIPEHGRFTWNGRYTLVDRPDRLEAEEWFIMGDAEQEGDPARQTLTFEATPDGGTLMTLDVVLAAAEDPEELREQSAAGLDSSLAAMDEFISG